MLTKFDVLSKNTIYGMAALHHPKGIFIMCVGNREKKQLFELMIALFACYFYPDLLLDPLNVYKHTHIYLEIYASACHPFVK